MGFKSILAGVALLLIMLVSVSTSQATNLVTNGGFEDGLNGWTVTGHVYSCGDPHNGNLAACFLDVWALGSIKQTLHTIIGQQYDLSYYLASDGGTPNEFIAIAGESVLFSQYNIAQHGYTLYDYTFTASSAFVDLTFYGKDIPGSLWLDDVSVTENVSAPVPEPSTMILLGLGLTGLAVYGKRRKNNKV